MNSHEIIENILFCLYNFLLKIDYFNIISLTIAVIAIIFSIISFSKQYRANIQPVIVFYNPGYDLESGENGWIMENVGNGIAINVYLMAAKDENDHDWKTNLTTLISALPVNKPIKLKKEYNLGTLYANYMNFRKKRYSTFCTKCKNSLSNKYLFKNEKPAYFQYQNIIDRSK